MYMKNYNLKKEVGIATKVWKKVTNLNQSLIKIPMHYPVLATVITQSQIHVQIKHSLANLQNIITTLTGAKYICKTFQQK